MKTDRRGFQFLFLFLVLQGITFSFVVVGGELLLMMIAGRTAGITH
jgi:hypothetical protein